MKTKNRRFYTTAEISKMLGITKNTLFNWEQADKIPKARRDPMNNYRVYTEKDIKKLKSITKR
ncbi:MAG: hypothetical protein COY53_02015 [Elusimicrobia bacterium CG_4_10_14_0_8_um_filter_37_32]|nr:MAG: hypothetical protein COS17_07630 [Elusimicrobia bacterium CG02_land_8_20_14_3_00_37_13]PIZ13990.1 MAG: hypothetical protein COY53_02015 [Elusimicrobia bacterium CG_4_10_14_0_8_um_filter_37_32]